MPRKLRGHPIVGGKVETNGNALDALGRPVIILVGHAGSGKSEIAVNLAFGMRLRGKKVALVDLDLVKPYFRSRLVRDTLAEADIDVVLPPGDLVYADLPIVPPEAKGYLDRSNVSRGDTTVIVDVGGNDSGARVLGSISKVVDQDAAEILFVVNANRPFAGGLEAMARMVADIEVASGLKVTGLVSNTHLMDETTPETVSRGLDASRELSRATGVPVRFCGIPDNLFPFPSTKGGALGCPVLALERHILPPHVQRKPGSRRALAL